MMYAIAVLALILAVSLPLLSHRYVSANTSAAEPPRISFLYWIFLVIFEPNAVWNRLLSAYGICGVLEVPFIGKAYLVMGPETTRAYHSSRALDKNKGQAVVLGGFYPSRISEGASDGKTFGKFSAEAGRKPLSSPTFTREVERAILKMLSTPQWENGFVPDLFAETWDLTMNLGLEQFVGLDESSPYFRALKDTFHLVDIEQAMQSPRMWYDKNRLVKEMQERYCNWADIFKLIVDERIGKLSGVGSNTPATDLLLSAAESAKDDNGQINYYDVMVNFWGLLLAAQVNTQANMAWVILRLAADPVLAQRVLDEQKTVLGGREGHLVTVTPTMGDLSKMELLDRVIAENLRLSGKDFVSFRMSDDDFKIDQYTIPAGSFCMFPHTTLNLNERLHEDIWRFDPDRTVPFTGGMDSDTAGPKKVGLLEGGAHSNYNFAVWGVGSHPCIGTKYATAIIKMAVSTIVRRYTLELVKGTWPVLPRFSLGTSKPTNKVQICVLQRAAS